mmetsp:Transcript_19083/g.23511  ORF Transcript_19083/g.23511 Transcript_19083/m.23511 type:complete len:92 (+) Transcript_19083:70-345(+)
MLRKKSARSTQSVKLQRSNNGLKKVKNTSQKDIRLTAVVSRKSQSSSSSSVARAPPVSVVLSLLFPSLLRKCLCSRVWLLFTAPGHHETGE